MKEREYEIITLLDPEGKESGLIDSIEDQLKGLKFNIKDKKNWGLRTLAYPIKNRTQARYVIFSVDSAEPQSINDLSDELLTREDILRFSIKRGGEG